VTNVAGFGRKFQKAGKRISSQPYPQQGQAQQHGSQHKEFDKKTFDAGHFNLRAAYKYELFVGFHHEGHEEHEVKY
jgi:hypothetical protein